MIDINVGDLLVLFKKGTKDHQSTLLVCETTGMYPYKTIHMLETYSYDSDKLMQKIEMGMENLNQLITGESHVSDISFYNKDRK